MLKWLYLLTVTVIGINSKFSIYLFDDFGDNSKLMYRLRAASWTISHSEYSHVGQNLGFVNSSEPFKDFKKTIKELVMLWYDEVSIFSRNWVPDTRDRGPKTKVGHYTQMMWADTSEVGCALTYYTTETTRKWNHIVLVCNYGPGGNYLGLPVYQIGEPTSKCPKDMKPNSRYRGLCGETKKVNEVKKIHNIFDF